MAGLTIELIDVLNEQAETVENLLALSFEKREVLMANDAESLAKITNVETAVVNYNKGLDKKRDIIVKNIAIVLNQKEELTLTQLGKLIENQPEFSELDKVSVRLRKAVNDLKESNALNQLLINDTLDYIEFTMNLIRNTVDDTPANYPSGGTDGSGGTAFFDVKQ